MNDGNALRVLSASWRWLMMALWSFDPATIGHTEWRVLRLRLQEESTNIVRNTVRETCTCPWLFQSQRQGAHIHESGLSIKMAGSVPVDEKSLLDEMTIVAVICGGCDCSRNH